VMPSNYALMSEEEMTYVEGGGWSTYKGLEALAGITTMCGAGFVAAGLTKAAGEALVASACTGVGLVAAIGLACGVALGITATAYQFGMAVCAATIMIASYKQTKSFSKAGYKACSYSAWTFTVFTQVSAL